VAVSQEELGYIMIYYQVLPSILDSILTSNFLILKIFYRHCLTIQDFSLVIESAW